MKCTNEKRKLKKILSCRFEKEKVERSNDKFAMDEFITVFFRGWVRQKKNRMSKDLRYSLCVVIEEKVCFEMKIYQLALCY